MPERVPLNLKAPAKPLTVKERHARMRESRAVLTDLQRQAAASSVITRESLKALPGPKQLHISVPDTDDWYAFCADLLAIGLTRWFHQNDREARYNNHDPSVPRFETWAAFRKALLQVGKRYWGARGKAGRPDYLGRCWRALWKELKAARATGRMKYRKIDMVPLMNGHPITQDEVQEMIRTGDHDPSPGAHNLSDKVCQKYGRLLYLGIKLKHQPLTRSDTAFLGKHLLPYFKKYSPDLANDPLPHLVQLFSVSLSMISLLDLP